VSDPAEALRFAHHLADVADAITLAGFRTARTRIKPDGTIVTEADEAAERAMRSEISAAYPDDGVLGEEGGTQEGTGRRWILDPIDGTLNYSFGVPVWATLIALEADGELVAGVVSAPALHERYGAARGLGARRNDEPIRVSTIEDLTEARLAYAEFRTYEACGHGEGFHELLNAVRFSRGFGDFWGHMLVAAGAMDVMVEPIVNVWDLAPLLVVVEEAGGRFTDLGGRRRIDGGSALTTNGALHDTVLSLFDR
jgi:histidinol-phosphatase